MFEDRPPAHEIHVCLDELQWLGLSIGYRDSSPSNGHQGGMAYWLIMCIQNISCKAMQRCRRVSNRKYSTPHGLCTRLVLVQGWGLLNQFPPFRYFPIFSALSNHTLAIEYHVYIWQVSPQLSCGDTCQIWMWFEESNMCFWQVENFAYGEINERSFSNPHPRDHSGRWLGQWETTTLQYNIVSHWPSPYTLHDHYCLFCICLLHNYFTDIGLLHWHREDHMIVPVVMKYWVASGFLLLAWFNFNPSMDK